MRIMKCILISFIAVNLALQGFIVSVLAADTAKNNITLQIHDPLKQQVTAEFTLKVKPLTMNEQVFLKTKEEKTPCLLDQAAGRYYDDNSESLSNQPPFINHPLASGIVKGAVIGAFIGWLTSSGKDIVSVRRSAQIGAVCGSVLVSILYVF